jgi:hypothetical protein
VEINALRVHRVSGPARYGFRTRVTKIVGPGLPREPVRVSESHEGTFCKPDYIEHGFISVVFFAQPGTGDTACITAVEAVIPVLFANLDPKLALINYEPVDEDSFGSADRDYRMSVSMNYRLSL